MQELWHLISDVGHLSENDVMLLVLGLVDGVIIGGYETFVSRINLRNHPDQPEWLSHVNANVLKVKLAMAPRSTSCRPSSTPPTTPPRRCSGRRSSTSPSASPPSPSP